MRYQPVQRPIHNVFSNSTFATRDDAEGTNRSDYDAPRGNGAQIQNVNQSDTQTDKHLGSTKTLVTTLDPGTYGMETISGGQVLVYRYDGRSLDYGATSVSGNGKDVFTTGDTASFLKSVNSKNKAMWPRPDPKAGMQRTFNGK